MAGSGNIGPIDFYAHSILAISDHAIVTIYQREIGTNIITNRGIILLGIVSV